jgi:group I intron endonuclease
MNVDRIIYKTTNLINGKIYIGKDKNNNPEYLGSGKLIRSAIKKYGRPSFLKEILEHCDNDISMNDRERYWIGAFNSRDKSIGYNISQGGDWGDILTNNPNRELIIDKIKKACKEKLGTAEHRHKMSIRLKGLKSPHKGKNRPELIGKNIRHINEEYQNKIIEMYKTMGVCKIIKILKSQGFEHGKCSIINFLERKGLYNRKGKRGPFGENILRKNERGQFISKSVFYNGDSDTKISNHS